MGRMVRHPEMVSNQSRHPGLGPDVALEAHGFRSLGQQLQELVPLCWGQTGRCSWGWLVAQTCYPSFSATLDPLANRPLGVTQGIGNISLLPTFLVQFPGPQTAAFPPIGSLA
jgi:hypothetical protein